MPRIVTLRALYILWMAWTEDDLGRRGPLHYGLTEQRARRRALEELE